MHWNNFTWIVLLGLAGCQSWDLNRAVYEGAQAYQRANQLPAEAREPISYDRYQRERERVSATQGTPDPSPAGPGDFVVEPDGRLRVLPKKAAQ